jgi:GNAT superfamily N-acetyltransferase
MALLEENERLEYRVISAEHLLACQELVSEGFSWEPSATFLEPDQTVRLQWFQKFVSYYAPECCTNGLSVMCQDKVTRSIVGAFFVKDYKQPAPAHFSLEGLGKIPLTLNILEELERQYDELRPDLQLGSCADLLILAVHPHFRRLRIADRLTCLACQIARDRGFSSVILEASGGYSARCAESAGLRKVLSIRYEEYDPVFCGLPEIHSQFTLWEMVFEAEGETGDAVSGERE